MGSRRLAMLERLKSDSAFGSIFETLLIVAVALGAALCIQKFLVKPFRIPSPSMVPTLVRGQRVLVNRIGHSFSKPSVGDVVVFHPPVGAGTATCSVEHPAGTVCPRAAARRLDINYIKRVVAVPGDRLKVIGGRAIRNGVPADEPFIEPCDPGGGCSFPREITVPADTYFMMGDNRGHSEDSRFWGPIPDDWIIGGAFATYWPLGRIGLL